MFSVYIWSLKLSSFHDRRLRKFIMLFTSLTLLTYSRSQKGSNMYFNLRIFSALLSETLWSSLSTENVPHLASLLARFFVVPGQHSILYRYEHIPHTKCTDQELRQLWGHVAVNELLVHRLYRPQINGIYCIIPFSYSEDYLVWEQPHASKSSTFIYYF